MKKPEGGGSKRKNVHRAKFSGIVHILKGYSETHDDSHHSGGHQEGHEPTDQSE
jgi:hypothetical protein